MSHDKFRERQILRAALALLVGCILGLILAALGVADTIELRPAADGAVEQWNDESAAACSSTDCFDSVDETSGDTCTTTPSDGDTTKISIATLATAQQFDLDESSIPDGSTATSAVVSACIKRGSGGSVSIGTRFCVNGSCSTSSTQAITNAYADYNFPIDFPDDTKDGTDDYEIGIGGTQTSRQFDVSAMRVVITYTPPAGAERPKRRALTID